ncbi:carbon storage regulator CsrA [Actinosynnema pretiosum subsp. pretiosum]|uniref:Translational regulator CsrA n=3 Tax=Actinosynnema TaxID=40566 RepID=C6WJS5_ACTMD|nr:carbon storage regulator, CsrA [Actinosynnema mirum DSM 43827]ATE53935.1 carbon storage regulator [Actinosynnema pretiosum]AXX29753.1 Carbon storage regulator [Actinosynnema pretiosum subsp. pretiosum]QUF06030.1 carbon storage regulator CsrA [Actinosynnema pretiosum subsp. pretiosum]
MLVLTRRAGESLRIGDDVTVTVLDVQGNVVRVGIQAPRSVAVHRDELYRALRIANEQAALKPGAPEPDLDQLLGSPPPPPPEGGAG